LPFVGRWFAGQHSPAGSGAVPPFHAATYAHWVSVNISKWRLAAFASPSVAAAAAGLPIALYLPAYYAADLGLGLTLLGSIFMFTKIWDVITDPIVGMLTDRYPTRWGRRRHWIALGTPLLGASRSDTSSWRFSASTRGRHSSASPTRRGARS
jgi:Na+/melibiose symporter-like transporter